EHWETKFDELKIRALASGEIEFKKANELIKELNTKLEHLAGSVSTDISSLNHQKMTEYFEHLKNIIGEKYNDFGLSVEKDSLNAQMKNAINSFSIEDISKYKIINDKTVTQEVTSKKW